MTRGGGTNVTHTVSYTYCTRAADYLVKSQIGCQIDNVCVNHVMYADDICLMAPSPAALQKLINICYDFSLQNNLTFNSSKSFCMVLDYINYRCITTIGWSQMKSILTITSLVELI